jgi:hypothetical protein
MSSGCNAGVFQRIEGNMMSAKPVSLVLRLIVAGSAALYLHGTASAAETEPLNQAQESPAVSASPAPVADDTAAKSDEDKAQPADAVTPAQATTEPVNAPVVAPAVTEPVPAASPAVQPVQAPVPVAPSTNPIKAELTQPSQAVTPVVLPTPLPQIQVPERTVPVVVFREEMLPIQPTIRTVARSAEVDLAASMPSVPVSDKTPVPAESNGALGGLRAVLLSTVVPPTFMPELAIGVVQGFELIALVSLLLLLAGYVFTYGLWLRRGGYVNAARSDAPSRDTTSSLFATPHLMGHGSLPPHRPGPLLVVLDINVPLFPTLIERRTCI